MTALGNSLLLSGLLWLAPLASAGDAEGHGELSSASDESGIDLRKLLAEVSRKTHKRFLIDPRVAANVQMIGFDEHDVTYPLLLQILAINGFAAIAEDGVVVIIPDSVARQMASPIVAADNLQAADAEWVTTIVAPKNVSAAWLVPILRPLMPQSGHMAAMPDRNALLLIDHAGNVRRLVAIIKALDAMPQRKVEEGASPR